MTRTRIRYRIVIAMLMLAVAAAAPQAGAAVRYGIESGVTHSRLTPGGLILNSERHDDFTGGVFALIPLENGFAVQPGVRYSRRGGSYAPAGSYPTGEQAPFHGAEFRVEYLEFPVLVRYHQQGKSFPAPGLVVGAAWSSILDSDLESLEYGNGEWVSGSEIDYLVGIGVGGEMGRISVGVDLVYQAPLKSYREHSRFVDSKISGYGLVLRVAY